MKKVASTFFLAVFVPAILLAWLALRSVRDEQVLIEHQRSLLYQGVADSLAKDVSGYLAGLQREFALQVESFASETKTEENASNFNDRLTRNWRIAQTGFVVSLDGKMYSPSPFDGREARQFRLENEKFLCNRESVEVYWNTPKGSVNLSQLEESSSDQGKSAKQPDQKNSDVSPLPNLKEKRSVIPQKEDNQFSKVSAAETEFHQLIGDALEGMLARFLQNKLTILLWNRTPLHPKLIFGAQLKMPRLVDDLKQKLQSNSGFDSALWNETCVALLDHNTKPLALSVPGFLADWKHPLAATEIGEALPHWEIALYPLNPARLTQSARTLRLTLGLIIIMLVMVIGIGSWLIVSDLRRHLELARQKTDFVSNVSHELKTPLTSIRMFSELLLEGRVGDPAKQKSYLLIITAEAGRLTRLINNVLDFSRMDRGEKKYQFEDVDLSAVARETFEHYRPHLEAAGFLFETSLPSAPLFVRADRDAIAQILVNLLSNAEKYSTDRKEIFAEMRAGPGTANLVEIAISDRGTGVPIGTEERIFEQFYRAHNSLNSGIQGSGLGLTLARQIARAHQGDIIFEHREGGGSRFILRFGMLLVLKST